MADLSWCLCGVWQEHGLTLSVMDYLPMNLVSGRQAGDQVDYFTPVIGTNTHTIYKPHIKINPFGFPYG